MKKWMRVFVVLTLIAVPAHGFAASPRTEEEGYSNQALAKMDYGLKNLLAGWTELITKPMKYHEDGKEIYKGAVVGLRNAVADTPGGAAHLITAMVPSIDIGLPDNGVQI